MVGFFKRIFGSEEEKQEQKPKVRSRQSKEVKENRHKSNDFLDQLELVIKEAKTMVSKSPKIDTIQNLAEDIVEGFFYGNVIINFKNNLNEENQRKLNISNKDINKIEKKFNALFERCKQTLESGSNEGKINLKEYKDFKKELKQISENSYKLLLELEKHIDITTCQNTIKEFKEQVKNLGKELKIGDVRSKDGSLGISIGFEGDDDEDYEGSDFDEEITDFNNFSIDLEEDYEEDMDFTHKNITLEDEKGHFYGSYNQSPSGKFIVAYDEGYLNENNEQVGGQVYLIENQKKILWKKRLERPNAGFVTDKGDVIIIDWTSSDQLVGKLFIFSKQGKKVFEHKFNSNMGGQDISPDGKEVIVTTCNPDNSIYLFNIENNKLVEKVKNTTSQRPLTTFSFNEIRKLI